MPNDVNPELWNIIKAMKEESDNNIKKLESKIQNLESDKLELSCKVKLLSGKVQRNEITISRLNKELNEVQGHSMKQNLIINFDKRCEEYKEREGEDCVSLVRHFVKTVLSVPNSDSMYIPVAHRIGPKKAGFHAQW